MSASIVCAPQLAVIRICFWTGNTAFTPSIFSLQDIIVFLFEHYLVYGKNLSGILFSCFFLPLSFTFASVQSFFPFSLFLLFLLVSLRLPIRLFSGFCVFYSFRWYVCFFLLFLLFYRLFSGTSVTDIRINLNELKSYNICLVAVLTSPCNLIQKAKIQ